MSSLFRGQQRVSVAAPKGCLDTTTNRRARFGRRLAAANRSLLFWRVVLRPLVIEVEVREAAAAPESVAVVTVVL